MRLSEAYSILEIPENTPTSEVKKKYKELSKKYHPDVNKESGAEDKFKKINEAYTRIQKGGNDDVGGFSDMGFNPFAGFNPFESGSTRQRQVSNIIIETHLTFAESVLGTKKDISFNRENKCSICNGQGAIHVNNGCDKCGGKGKITGQQGNMIFVQTCTKCRGHVKSQSCNSCSDGVVSTEVSISVNIPGGVTDGNILRLAGMGNFAGQFMSMDQFSDAHLVLHVAKDDNLRIENNTVVYDLQISLLEALRGCSKSVPTVVGNRDISIKSLSKNQDEILMPNFGINRIGDQKVVLHVSYPQDVSKIIDVLQTENI